MTIMNWKEWEPHYSRIVSELGLDPEADRQATFVLTDLLSDIDPTPVLERLRVLIEDKDIVVCGAGPSLQHHLEEILPSSDLSEATFVAADGAASALLEFGYRCDILVTDLDGDLDALNEVIRRGAIPIVHAHGDNLSKVREFVPPLDFVLGSTQVEPTRRAFLWGGFTDGDRACYLASHYSPNRVILAGMDFGDLVGRWSKPGHEKSFAADERKRAKLRIAKELLMFLKTRVNLDFTVLE